MVNQSHTEPGIAGYIFERKYSQNLSVDPQSADYPAYSPYNYTLNNPIKLIDIEGKDPIDPRTGKSKRINVWRDALMSWNSKAHNPDVELFKRVTTGWNFGKTSRSRSKPDGMYEGGKGLRHKSSLSETSLSAKSALKNIFGLNDVSSFGAPCDYAWSEASLSGNYTYINSNYSQSELFYSNLDSYNVIEVQDNYITKIASLKRNNNGEFDLSSTTTLNVEKGDVQTRSEKTWWGGSRNIKYRQLHVTETTQTYKNNEATGNPTVRVYTVEELIK